MKPAGIIITFMDWSKWKTWWFNIPLFLFQLTFMVVGTAIGKIKWEDPRLVVKTLSIVGYFVALIGVFASISAGNWYLFFPNFMMIVNFIAMFCGMDMRRVWRAAQASHVRLCLRLYVKDFPTWEYINFGYPTAKLGYWTMTMVGGKRFEYREPTFTFSQERIDSMIQYAEDQVGKKYDWLQLLSPPANFPIWIIYPPQWGKEIIRWFNLPGAREYCSSGAVATLLWFAESRQVGEDIRITDGNKSGFFGTYDPAMVMPCMFVISDKWRKVE